MSDTIHPSELAQQYATLPYTPLIRAGESGGKGCYVARFLEIPGALAQGDNPEQALSELLALLPEFIEVLIEGGADIPLPQPTFSVASAPIAGYEIHIDIPDIQTKREVFPFERPILSPQESQYASLTPA